MRNGAFQAVLASFGGCRLRLKLENVRSELGWRLLPLVSMIFWGALKWPLGLLGLWAYWICMHILYVFKTRVDFYSTYYLVYIQYIYIFYIHYIHLYNYIYNL